MKESDLLYILTNLMEASYSQNQQINNLAGILLDKKIFDGKEHNRVISKNDNSLAALKEVSIYLKRITDEQ